MDDRQLATPCPHCGECGHAIVFIQEGLSIVCPALPANVLLWLMPDGKILRDNRGQFRKKTEPVEFPEFTDDADFFDAHQTIEA
jgi:hypothetical protein